MLQKKGRPKKTPISVGNIDWKREMLLTFSNNKSLLSSKKIERFIVFTTFLIITVVYIIINIRTIEAFDLVEILGIWFAYIGVHSFINQRDRRMDIQSEATSDEEGDISR